MDHAWTYQVRHARRHLEVMPGLLQRMAALFDLDSEGMDVNTLIEEVLTQSWRYGALNVFSICDRLPTAQGKWQQQNLCQGKHRELENFAKTLGICVLKLLIPKF